MFLPKKKNTEIFHIKKRASYFNLEETSGELKHTIIPRIKSIQHIEKQTILKNRPEINKINNSKFLFRSTAIDATKCNTKQMV